MFQYIHIFKCNSRHPINVVQARDVSAMRVEEKRWDLLFAGSSAFVAQSIVEREAAPKIETLLGLKKQASLTKDV
jgi:hypothetical protein